MNLLSENNTETIDCCNVFITQIKESLNLCENAVGRENKANEAKKSIEYSYNWISHNRVKQCNNLKNFENTVIEKLRSFLENNADLMGEFSHKYLDLFSSINVIRKKCLICNNNPFSKYSKVCTNHRLQYSFLNLKNQIVNISKCYHCKKFKKCNVHAFPVKLKNDIHDMKKNICQHHGCGVGTYFKHSFWHCIEHKPTKLLKMEVKKYICNDIINIVMDYYSSMNDFDDFKSYYQISYCTQYECIDNDGYDIDYLDTGGYCDGHVDETITHEEFLLGYYMSYGNWFMSEFILKSESIRSNYKETAIVYGIRFGMFGMAKYFLEQQEIKELHVCGDILGEARANYNEKFFNYIMKRNLKNHFPEFDMEIKVTKKKEKTIKDEEKESENIPSKM